MGSTSLVRGISSMRAAVQWTETAVGGLFRQYSLTPCEYHVVEAEYYVTERYVIMGPTSLARGISSMRAAVQWTETAVGGFLRQYSLTPCEYDVVEAEYYVTERYVLMDPTSFARGISSMRAAVQGTETAVGGCLRQYSLTPCENHVVEAEYYVNERYVIMGPTSLARGISSMRAAVQWTETAVGGFLRQYSLTPCEYDVVEAEYYVTERYVIMDPTSFARGISSMRAEVK